MLRSPRRNLVVSVGAALSVVAATPAAPPSSAQCAECPPGAIVEGEPCGFGSMGDDSLNCGCTCGQIDDPGPFTSIECGATYCGEGYFDGQYRDTDWFELLVDRPTVITARAVAEFESSFFWFRDPGPDQPHCEILGGFERIDSPACTEAVYETESTTQSGFWYMLATQFTSVVDCEIAGFRWILSVECELVPPPCVWDFDGDGEIGFADLLVILANWGPCPE